MLFYIFFNCFHILGMHRKAWTSLSVKSKKSMYLCMILYLMSCFHISGMHLSSLLPSFFHRFNLTENVWNNKEIIIPKKTLLLSGTQNTAVDCRVAHSGFKWIKPAKNKFTWCDFTNFSKQVSANLHIYFRFLGWVLN